VSLVTAAHTFVTGEILTAVNLNANPTAFVNGFANIDHTNIGGASLWASNIVPNSSAAATFGGSLAYTFPSGLVTGGTLTATTGSFSAGLTSTTGAFSGLLSSTIATGAFFSDLANATTAGIYMEFSNTGAEAIFGIESSAGGSLVVGTSAYSTVLSQQNARSLHFGTNNAVVQTITSAGLTTFTGAVQAGSATAGTATAGDVWASRSTTTGVLNLGGSSSSVTIDYGVTNVGALTMEPGLGVYMGTLEANSVILSGAGPVSLQATGSLQPGHAGTNGNSVIYSGTGVPSFSATNGSLFLRYDGATASTVFYVNTSGASSSGTTWSAVTIP
jgi:hypothetical protein